MSYYRMDIKGDIGLNEYSNINDYLCIVDKNDKFTIVLDNINNKDIGVINSMLENNSFSVCDRGYNNHGSYYINAYKIK